MKKIYCKKNNGNLDFYMIYDKKEYYLFSQTYKRGVEDFYKQGVFIDKAIHHGIGKKDCSIHKTMDKLIKYIKYLEKETNVIILKKTQKCAA